MLTLFDGCVFLVCECFTCVLVYLQQYHSVEHAQPSTWPGARALEPQTLTIGAVQRVRVAPLTHDETCVSHVRERYTCIVVYLQRYDSVNHAPPCAGAHCQASQNRIR